LRNSTIRLITVVAAVIVLGIFALIVKLTTHSNDGGPAAVSGSSATPANTSPAVTGQEPKVPGTPVYNGSEILKAVCTLDKTGWNLAIGNPNGFPVSLDWVQIDFYAGTKNTGSQNAQTNVPVTLAPGQINNSATTAEASFGGNGVPDSVYANTPGSSPRLTSCQATQWGDSQGY
jgi:hypothetical protein